VCDFVRVPGVREYPHPGITGGSRRTCIRDYYHVSWTERVPRAEETRVGEMEVPWIAQYVGLSTKITTEEAGV
jgi:hypothetical protein